MASANVVPAAEKNWPLSNPWPWMIAGLAAAALGFLLVQVYKEALTPVRVALVFMALLAAGVAVSLQPGSVKVLLGAAAVAFVDCWALYAGKDRATAWDSIRWVLAVLVVVALFGAFLVALPRLWRRVVISLLVVVHFGGICTAVLRASPGPWLAELLWVRVYRPYLEFMYLVNAYHFYAPDPGSSYFLWFHVEYTEEGDKATYWKWIKVPDIDDDSGWPKYPLALQYQRRLAMANLVTQNVMPLNTKNPVHLERVRRHEQANLERYGKHLPIIPLSPNFSVPYAEPIGDWGRIAQSCVRHVAYRFLQENPGASISAIKLYRVEHLILNAGHFARGILPQDPVTYLPYFWGEFDSDGNLKSPEDPFLYWHIPFLQVRPDKTPFFPANEDVLRKLMQPLPRYLHEYAEGKPFKLHLDAQTKKRPQLYEDLSGDPILLLDIKNLAEKQPLPSEEAESFLKKHPGIATDIKDWLKEYLQERTAIRRLLADLPGENKLGQRAGRLVLDDSRKLGQFLDDVNRLLNENRGLIAKLILHRKYLGEKGKATLTQVEEVAQVMTLWRNSRLRLTQDTEDHFDIAVATAMQTTENEDTTLFDYVRLHVGDPRWVRYPGQTDWEELKDRPRR